MCIRAVTKGSLMVSIENGAPGEIRTPDQLVRSQLLYPAELQALIEEAAIIKRNYRYC